MKLKIAGVCVAFLLAACGKPMDAVIPTEKEAQAQFAEKVISKLSEEDKKLYVAWIIRRGVVSTFNNTPMIPEGTTVAKAIEEQKEWIAKQEAAKAEELRLTQEREAARAAAQQQLEKSVRIKFAGHELRQKNYKESRYSDQQTIYLVVESLSDKVIHGIKATIHFTDMFGQSIDTSPFEITDTIQPGESFDWIAHKDLNQFSDADKKLMSLEKDKYSTEITVQMIVFADGTKLQSP